MRADDNSLTLALPSQADASALRASAIVQQSMLVPLTLLIINILPILSILSILATLSILARRIQRSFLCANVCASVTSAVLLMWRSVCRHCVRC